MTETLARRADLLRVRGAVFLLFLLSGMIIGAWTSRIPAIKQGLGLTDGQLSLGLLSFAAGAIVGMQIAGRLIDRYGSARIMIPVALVDGALLVLPAYAASLLALAAGLFTLGVVHNTLNVAMNAHAVRVERAWRRPIMSSFHAVYSIGGFAGTAVGGLFAETGRSPAATFLTVAALTFLLASGATRWTVTTRERWPLAAHQPTTEPPPAEQPPATTPRGNPANPMHGVFLLGVLAFCCFVGEGAAADWSTVYLRDDLGGSPGLAAAAYAAFSIMMMAGRLVGDWLTARLGPVRLVRACGVLAGAGLGGALLIGHPVAGVLGFGCLGAGLSCIAPQVFSAAGNQNPARAGGAIARVASLGYVGFFLGPILIGGAAELAGLPRALAIPVVLAIFVAIAARALRTLPAPALRL